MHHPAHRRTAAAVLTSLILVLEACGTGSAPPAPSAPVPTGSGVAIGETGTSELPSIRPPLPLPADIPTAVLTAEAGDVIATGTVTPEDGGRITGTDADGTVYTLRVEPFSVTTDVTIGIRPLHGTTELGTIVAGADLMPAGLRLLRPAELTIESPGIQAGWAAFDYRGDPSTATAHLVTDGYPEAEFVILLVPHFSGSVAVDLGKDAGSLYDKWATTRGDDTPTGRQAAAEVRYGAATMAEQSGRISPETANGIRDRATSDWIAAERDRLATDPEMVAIADGGRPEDVEALSAEVGRIIEFEARRAAVGDESGNLAAVVDVLVRYETAITTKVLNSAELQAAADSGRVSDIGQILDLFQLIAGLDRQIQLLGGLETPGTAKMFDLLARVRTGLLRTCKEAPVDPLLILGLDRFVQLLGAGTDVSFADIADCAGLANQPTPRAGLHRITGQITLDYTSRRGDHARAVFELVILEGITGTLAFGPGSKGKVDWTLTEPWEGCPAAGSSSVTIGTMNNEVVHELSEPDPGTTGLPLRRGADLAILGLSVPIFQKGTGLRDVGCMFPEVSLNCGYGSFTGKLVHANPSEWSFSCSSNEQDEFWSTGGRLIATW